MSRILVFGNSGSGKSTLAKRLCETTASAHLDLDTLAWKPVSPPERLCLEDSAKQITEFIKSHEDWVIEGCYTDLLETAAPYATEVIFMNLPVEECIKNAKRRPWEQHKYESSAAQNANLPMLLDWIAQYPNRTDTFSQTSHLALYQKHGGKKRMLVENE